MLALTEAAAAAINALVEQSGLELGGLRFVSTGDPRADDFDLTLVDGPVEGDHIVVVHGASVFVDPALAPLVADSILDAVLDEDGVHFGFVDHDDAAHEHFHGE